MSKSKEECLNIINQQFTNLENKKDENSLFIALEQVIIEISSSEFSLVWVLNNKRDKIETYYKNKRLEVDLEESILKSVLLSKKGFFDNFVVNHPQYNFRVDNILNINIKSIIVVPILDKATNEVVAFVVAFNSINHKEEFRRYDIRSLGLLSPSVFNLLKISKANGIVGRGNSLVKKKDLNRAKTKIELERELNLYKIKLQSLEKELLLKTEALADKEAEMKASVSALTVVQSEEDNNNPLNHNDDIYTILNFLNDEVHYLANEEHTLYLFLEIVKNSLHNKDQLKFLNRELEKLGFIEKVANALYIREKMPILIEPFNLYQLVNDISTLYSKTFSDKNITFNIFLNPNSPNIIVADKDKIKSLIVHLMNNIFNFITNSGAIDLSINFSNREELLTLEVISVNGHQTEKIKNFFAHKEMNQTLKYSESGLGLSVGSNLVKILNGKLKLSARGEDKHLFTVSLPVKKSRESKVLEYPVDNSLKVAILMSRENHLAVKNLIDYLHSMGVDEKFIFTFESARKIKDLKISHLFCFENIYSSELDLNGFPSITLLKYSQKKLNIQRNGINTLYVNSYYGLELQKILFPNIVGIEVREKTLLIEDSFLAKFSNVVKKLKLS